MPDTLTTFLDLTKPEVGASAATWGAKINTDMDSVDTAIARVGRLATYGGTADAITLTINGAAVPAAAAGDLYRFRATAANTGAATINETACVTVTGAVLPAGYIRTGVDTVCWHDGTNWVVDRLPETGSNANGRYERLASGLQTCAVSIASGPAANSAFGSIYANAADSTWTFPAGFVSTTDLACAGGVRLDGATWMRVRAASATTAGYRRFSATAAASAEACELQAIGRWY